MSTRTLEQRIASALADEDVVSDDLAALIVETEAAVAAADKTAEEERVKALDPALSPDPKKARAAMEDAEFCRDRLKTVLPRLQQRCSEVRSQEAYAHWEVDYEDVKAHRDAVAEALKTLYLDFIPKLINCLGHCANADVEVARVNSAKPHNVPQANGDGRWLLSTELTARGLHDIAPGFSLAKDMKLPSFHEPAKLAWPPPQPSLAVLVAADVSRIAASHHRADWHLQLEERERQRAEAREAAAAHDEKMNRERAERERQEALKAQQEAAAERNAAGRPSTAGPHEKDRAARRHDARKIARAQRFWAVLPPI